MAPSENQQHNPNPAPPLSSAGDHEMRNYYAAQDAPRPPSQQEPYLTPYLGLRARLSQAWINRWTVLLLLVLIRTLFAIASLDDNLGQAREKALSACTSVENVGSAMASMPYYMAQGVNELSAQGIEKAINGLMQMLIMSITGVEEIVVFIINLLTQTYVCLITFAVGGSLHAAVAVAEDVGNFLNSTMKDIGKDLGNAASEFEDAMNDFVGGLDDIGDFFTGDKSDPPKIDLSKEIDKLERVQLPPDYDQDLRALKDNIPTFEQVNKFTNDAIKWPFEEVKQLLNESLPKYTMDRALFPVPAKEKLTFCSDDNGINDFFDDLVAIEVLAKKIFLATLIALAVLAMIPMAWREIRRFKMEQERARLIKSDAFDPMDAVYIASRPYTSTAGLKLADNFESKRRQTLVRWSIAYATTVPALFILTLAIAGLLACLCQYILLKTIEKEIPQLENQIIGFANKVMYQLNNASEQWAVGTNSIINDTNTQINEDVFGWVNTTTTAVNDTLNVFVDGVTDVLNNTFGGTILYEPVLDILECLILLKIEGIQKGLTWVSEHAHVDFPFMPKDTFSLGALDKVAGSEADILAAGPDSGAANAITGAIYHVTNAIERGIRQEAIISTCVLLIWVIIALIGISRALLVFVKGGDEGVYNARSPTPAFGWGNRGGDAGVQQQEKYEMRNLPRVPTYEQATRSAEPGDNTANRYNGQSYTLSPNPMPTLEVNGATSPILHTGYSPRTEKLGTVNGQFVDAAIRRPTHVRASSYGDYVTTSPTSAIPQTPFGDSNFLQPIDRKQNPFADPVR
ncbi:plasma membrane fusion protein prm1 [Vermiconidia calcicola]|uniref:Plasma membrane fusion protein prm1 n=1 Tax=Vermiconidia calcicola TaxID=1690605 RepID=A0ACC3MI17_9PEZI|nr:plasma membrane fusion protein prm1 [Vermiconidia calcicola]